MLLVSDNLQIGIFVDCVGEGRGWLFRKDASFYRDQGGVKWPHSLECSNNTAIMSHHFMYEQLLRKWILMAKSMRPWMMSVAGDLLVGPFVLLWRGSATINDPIQLSGHVKWERQAKYEVQKQHRIDHMPLFIKRGSLPLTEELYLRGSLPLPHEPDPKWTKQWTPGHILGIGCKLCEEALIWEYNCLWISRVPWGPGLSRNSAGSKRSPK